MFPCTPLRADVYKRQIRFCSISILDWYNSRSWTTYSRSISTWLCRRSVRFAYLSLIHISIRTFSIFPSSFIHKALFFPINMVSGGVFMDQTVLFFILIACIIAQALFLLNHRYFLRGIIFSAVSGAGCLVLMQSFFPFLGLAVTAPSLIISSAFGIPGCIFLLLLKLICPL